MKKRNIKFIFKTFAFVVLSFIILSILAIFKNKMNEKVSKYIDSNSTFAKNVDDNNELLIKFKEMFSDYEVILACSEDITNDGKKDLVVICKNDGNMKTIALIDLGNGKFEYSEPIPAPKENQLIKFFNMDNAGAIEVLITGEAKGQVGYAIYRYEDKKLIDIFGEGMEDCC